MTRLPGEEVARQLQQRPDRLLLEDQFARGSCNHPTLPAPHAIATRGALYPPKPVAFDREILSYQPHDVKPALTGAYLVTLASGRKIECKTVWQLLKPQLS